MHFLKRLVTIRSDVMPPPGPNCCMRMSARPANITLAPVYKV